MDQADLENMMRKNMMRERNRQQAKWRPRILKRDRKRCRACGEERHPEVAHVTAVNDFVAVRVDRKNWNPDHVVASSYREDNLLVLCKWCHRSYDAPSVFWYDDDPLVEAAEGPSLLARTRGVLRKRRGLVRPVIDAIVQNRGWREPKDVL